MKKRIQMNALFIILQVNKILFTLYRSPSSTQNESVSNTFL